MIRENIPPPPQFRTSQMPSYVAIDAMGNAQEKPNVLIRVMSNKRIDRAFGFRITAKKARVLSKWLEHYAAWAETLPSQGGR